MGFVSGEGEARLIVIAVNKRLDTDGGRFAVVGDLLVGDGNVKEIFECQRGLTQGKAEIDVDGQIKRHDMGIEFTIFQGRCMLGEGV